MKENLETRKKNKKFTIQNVFYLLLFLLLVLTKRTPGVIFHGIFNVHVKITTELLDTDGLADEMAHKLRCRTYLIVYFYIGDTEENKYFQFYLESDFVLQ